MDLIAYNNLKDLCHAHGAKLIAVSKTRTNEEIMNLYNKGHRAFGENKVQELMAKYEHLPKDIEWHLIGTLQSNKVKYVAPMASLVHSVDRRKILKYLNKEAKKADRIVPILFQFHIAEEDSKQGYDIDELRSDLDSGLDKWTNLKYCGVMGMATFTDDMNQVRKEFRNLKSYFDTLQSEYFPANEDFKEISMGMSGDYEVALEEGATMVRIGTMIFGPRRT